MGLKPNHITAISFCFSLSAASSFVILPQSGMRALLAGALILISGLFDAIDGLVARLYREQSRFGAFLDSMLDRISEIAIFWAVIHAGAVDWSLGLVALSLSLMVSYARARAEPLGAAMKGIGIAERPERLLILAAATILGQLSAGAALIAVLSGATLLQRLWYARVGMSDTKLQV